MTGDDLARVRKRLGLSLRDIAQRIPSSRSKAKHVTVMTVWKWEKGITPISERQQMRLAAIFWKVSRPPGFVIPCDKCDGTGLMDANAQNR